MEELVNLFKGARRRFGLWKISACREGAREAWAMVKTRYTGLDPNHMARVGPRGSDGREIPVSLVYGQVKVATKFSQQDCKLDSLLEGLEEEEVFESKWQCTFINKLVSNRICKTIVLADSLLRPPKTLG